MLDIVFTSPTNIIPNILRGLSCIEQSKKMEEKLKINNDIDNIILRLNPSTESVSLLEPRQALNIFNYILYMSNEEAKSLYSRGARSLNELVNYSKYELTTPQRLGCKYYNDLLDDNDDQEIEIWKILCMKAIEDLDCSIFNVMVQHRRLKKVHSRMEICICLSNDNVIDHIEKFMYNLRGCINSDQSNLYEPLSSNESQSYAKVGCIGNLNKSYPEVRSKITLIDVTFYSTKFYPLPLLRSEEEEWKKHNIYLSDTEITLTSDKLHVFWRKYLGNDNPSSLEECLNVMEVMKRENDQNNE